MVRSYFVPALLLSLTAMAATCLGNVVINEVDIAPTENYLPNWVELYNSGDQPVDIGGWSAQIIEPPWAGTMPVPSGLVLQPKEFYVLYGDPRWTHGTSGVVILRDAAGVEADRTPLISDNRTDDFTWARYPDGKDTGRKSDWAYIRASRGFANSLFG